MANGKVKRKEFEAWLNMERYTCDRLSKERSRSEIEKFGWMKRSFEIDHILAMLDMRIIPNYELDENWSHYYELKEKFESR